MATKRRVGDWITAFDRFTDNSESPRSYHIWAACSTISAALQRRTYINWGHDTIYPNMYVVLIGPSGKVRKSDPISIAKRFAEKLNITIVGEDNTVESLIQDMAGALTSFAERGTKRIMMQSAASCFIEELAVFTGEHNTRFLAYLTNWADARASWKRGTKNMGRDEITGVCLNMLAASAPDWLSYILPREAIGGGFTARCIFVVEDKKGKVIANPNLIRTDKELERMLVADLQVINTMSGEFQLDKAATDEYTTWYEHEEEKIVAGHPTVSDPMLQTYNSRRATHVKRLAMIMSVSRGDDYTINTKDFKRAKTLLEVTEKKMPAAFNGIGRAKYAEETEMLMRFIAQRGTCTKSDILRQFYKTIDDFGLEIIIKVLSGMKVIKVIIGPGETSYQYTGGVIT